MCLSRRACCDTRLSSDTSSARSIYGYDAVFGTFCFAVSAFAAPAHAVVEGSGALYMIPNTNASFARRAARTSTRAASGVGGARTLSAWCCVFFLDSFCIFTLPAPAGAVFVTLLLT
jgi:hypothetical protein